MGILEMFVIGAHQKSGFKEIFDMHASKRRSDTRGRSRLCSGLIGSQHLLDPFQLSGELLAKSLTVPDSF